MIDSLAVFLGSRDGTDPRLARLAHDIGAELARRDIALVYGAGSRGLMGHLSTGAIEAGGRVSGVVPRFMVDREWARSSGPRVEIKVVETMHERKAQMATLADAFLVLPGGIGTLEEFFEIWTWGTLGLHSKPIGLLNHDGFWDPLLEMLHRVAAAGFVDHRVIDALVVGTTLDEVLESLSRTRHAT